jgi:hypothetical protein
MAENEKVYNSSNMQVEDYLGKARIFQDLNDELE